MLNEINKLKAQGYNSICFWFPSISIGGGTHSFVKLAKEFLKCNQIKVYFLGYKDDYAKVLFDNKEKINFIDYKEGDIVFPIKEKMLIVTNSIRPIQLTKMNIENKIVLWHWETTLCAWHVLFLDNETKIFFNLVNETKCMTYIDWGAKNSIERQLNIKLLNNPYLPIILDSTENYKLLETTKLIDNEINVCWLSRLATEKIQALYYLIRNISNYKTNKKINLHIIGDGVRSKEVKEFVKNYKNINFIFTGTLPLEVAREYIANKTDIVFGMGTSVLESAALKIPSVGLLLDDYKNTINSEYAFWLFNSADYCTAIMQYQADDFNGKLTKITDMIDIIYKNPENKKIYGNKSYEHYMKYHSSYYEASKNLLKVANNSNLTFAKLEKCIKYTPYNIINVKKVLIKNFKLISIIKHINSTRVKILNTLCFKITKDKVYINFFGKYIKLFNITQKNGFDFPSTKFDNRKDYMKQSNKKTTTAKINQIKNVDTLNFFGLKFRIIHIGEKAKNIYFYKLPLFSYREKNGKAKINLLFITRFLKVYNDKKMAKLIKNKKNNAIKLKKEKIKICFFIARPGMWCFDELYKLVIQNQKLESYIVITPDVLFPKSTIIDFTNKLKLFFETKGYKNIICGYDSTTNKIIDIKNTINPDIIIHTDFMKMHIDNLYYITRFQDKINFLNEYGYSVMEDKLTCNYELNNLVDIYFRPSVIHKEMAEKYMNNKGKNVKIVGSPKLDIIHNTNYLPSNPWKTQNKLKKRIIWAPHHSLKHPNDMYQYNSFLDLYDFMLELANTYKDNIQIAFRPHPMLEVKLARPEWWGLDKQKEYYQKWDELENCQYYSDGEFMDLFLTSDAMVMDSCSFMAEYTSCNKPLLHTIGSKTRLGLNEFGEKLYEVCYKTKNDLKQDIINFIEDVVLKENDCLKQERTKFVKKYFSKINGKTASENIYQEILKIIN